MAFNFNKICSNVVPNGTYKAVITDVKFKLSATGAATNDMQIYLNISEGPYAKKPLMDTIVEKAFSFRLMPFLKAVGIDTNREFETAKELYEYGIRTAKGKTVLIEVGSRPYNGNTYNQINTYSPLPGSTVSADDVMKHFDTNPNVLSEKPKLDEVVGNDTDMPKIDLDVSDDDEDLIF